MKWKNAAQISRLYTTFLNFKKRWIPLPNNIIEWMIKWFLYQKYLRKTIDFDEKWNCVQLISIVMTTEIRKTLEQWSLFAWSICNLFAEIFNYSFCFCDFDFQLPNVVSLLTNNKFFGLGWCFIPIIWCSNQVTLDEFDFVFLFMNRWHMILQPKSRRK